MAKWFFFVWVGFLIGWAVIAAIAIGTDNAEAKDFPPAPAHVSRIDASTFRIDSGWYDLVKNRVCPGHMNNIDQRHTQADGSMIVVCDEDTFFHPEPPVRLNSPADSRTPRVITKIVQNPPVVKTVTHAKTVIRTKPILAMSIFLILAGIIVGGIGGFVFAMVRRPA